MQDNTQDITRNTTQSMNANGSQRVPKRIARTVIQALKGGVVPRIGLPYITVGRKYEIDALLSDVDIIADGGATCRFIVGRYGSGKSFLIQALRNYVMDKNFIVADADLSPERRLQGTQGQGLATYRELISNLATKTQPEGGALQLILDRWITRVEHSTAQQIGLNRDDPSLERYVDERINDITAQLNDMVHGFEFAALIKQYYHASRMHDDLQRAAILRWLRGEYTLKRDVKEALGINVIINDANWYDYIKLFAQFFTYAGYTGLIIMIDECVNIYKIPHSVTRQNNYEKMLMMYNDTLQGKAHHLGIIFGATPQALEDKRRGIYSYEALRSRLTAGKFSRPGARDLWAPVIHLDPLTPEEMLVLCEKLMTMHAHFYGYDTRLSTEDLAAFMRIEYSRVGADEHITPREVIRDFIELCDLLYQHSDMSVRDIMNDPEFRQYQQSQHNVDIAHTAHPHDDDSHILAEFTI